MTQKQALEQVLLSEPGKRWALYELKPVVEQVYGGRISETGLSARGRELHWQSTRRPGTKNVFDYWL